MNMLFEFDLSGKNAENDHEIPDIFTSISDLSQEILVIVLSFLPLEDLSRLARVNSEWLLVTQDKALWIPYGIKKGLLQKKPKSNPEADDEYEELNEQTKAKCVDTRVVERNWEKSRYYVQSFSGHTKSIRSVSYLDDLLATASEDETAKLWSISTGKCLRTIFGHRGWVYTVQCGNGIVVTGSQDRQIKAKVWQINSYFSSTCVHTFTGHENSIITLQFDPLKVVSGSTDKSIRVWDINTGNLVSTLLGHNDSINKVQISGDLIYSASSDHTAKVWDIRIGDSVSDLIGHKNSVNDLKMDTTSDKLYTASSDLTIGVWDMANLHHPHYLDGHMWHVQAIDVVGDRIISASGDKTIRVWDKEREKETNVMRDHFSQSIVCMQADPRKIVCGSYDKSVKIFHFGKPFF